VSSSVRRRYASIGHSLWFFSDGVLHGEWGWFGQGVRAALFKSGL